MNPIGRGLADEDSALGRLWQAPPFGGLEPQADAAEDFVAGGAGELDLPFVADFMSAGEDEHLAPVGETLAFGVHAFLLAKVWTVRLRTPLYAS